MKTRFVAMFGLAAGLAVMGATTASAAEYRDVRQDHARVDAVRADMARDQARLNADLRYGRRAAAFRDQQDLARDRAALNAQLRDIRHDRRDDRDWR